MEFTLRWIGHEQTGHESCLDLTYNAELIHREPMFFEDGKCYGEVCAILKEKYGDRLKDVVPKPPGWLYLGGDAFSSLGAAKESSLALFGKITTPQDFKTT